MRLDTLAPQLLEQSQKLAHLGSYSLDVRSGQVVWSDEVFRIFRYQPQEFEPNFDIVVEHVHPKDRERFIRLNQAFWEGKCNYDVIYRLICKDGSIRTVRSIADIIRDDDGTPIRMFGAVQDITEYQDTLLALAESEQRFRSLVENLAHAVFVHDFDGRFLLLNNAASLQTGYTKDELLGMTVADIDAESVPRNDMLRFWKRLKLGENASFESFHLRKDGSTYPAELLLTRMQLDGRPVILAVAQDITDRKQQEAVLAQEQQRLLSIFNTLPEFLCIVDKRHRIRFSNRAFREIFGDPERGHCYEVIRERTTPCVDCPAIRVMQSNKPLHWEWTGSNDSTYLIHTLPYNPGEKSDTVLQLGVDISRRKRAERRHLELEAQLRQSQKLEAIGQLAGGVAHFFNNILTSILGNAEMLQMSLHPFLPLDHTSRTNLDQIVVSGERAAALTRQLLAFGRKQLVSPKNINPLSVVKQAEEMLRPVIREDIVIDIEPPDFSCCIHMDPGQLEQAIVNLILNAQDAMADGGRLRIAASHRSAQDCIIESSESPPQTDYVSLSFSDTGIGIPPEQLDHVFEPFFTTKDVGEGSGLGLSMVDGIVAQAGGFISVDSEVGAGTTIALHLPLSASKN